MLVLPVLASLCYGPLVGRYAARFPFYRSWIVLAVIGGSVLMWTVVLLWLVRRRCRYSDADRRTRGRRPGSMLGLDYARTFNPLTRFGAANGMVNTGGFIAMLICIGNGRDSARRVVGRCAADPDRLQVGLAFQYVLWAIGTRQILKYRRKARGNLALTSPRPTRALLANQVVPLKG